jgi:hypothetical protein
MKYCIECGAKIPVTDQIAKFCHSCGASLNGSSNASTQEPAKTTQASQRPAQSTQQHSSRGYDRDGIDADLPDLTNFELELESVEANSLFCRETDIKELSQEEPGQIDAKGSRGVIKNFESQIKDPRR